MEDTAVELTNSGLQLLGASLPTLVQNNRSCLLFVK
jgi:hypothetical protein